MSAPTPTFDAPFTVGAQLEARAQHVDVADRPVLVHEDRVWTYKELRDHGVRGAHFLLERLGRDRPGRVAMLLENHPELIGLYTSCAYAGMTLFGVNTGLRGETLAGVLDQSGAELLVVDEKLADRVLALEGKLAHLKPENLLVLPTGGGTAPSPERDYLQCLEREIPDAGAQLDPPDVDVQPDRNLMVIYTSGTTGLPKGINNNHFKLLAIGKNVSERLQLAPDSCGYACMPLFHSNALFLGFHPAFHVGARMSMRERFSASAFVPDVKRYGVTYWNYVGEPVHYILGAIEREYGGDEERIRKEVAEHPDNRLRFATGNGASPPDIDRFLDWLGMEDMYELYGSTEAAISTFRTRFDPRGSVGAVNDEHVKILREDGAEAPPAELDADGKILNYAEAVGEICRVAPDTALFQGYFDNAEANTSKYREGVYHSGDLGHIVEEGGKRFLYFDGRTDDWIRKDGENFSAAQVARILQEHPDVVLAAAYGVPCVVSDELVMAALKLRPGARFDPQAFFRFCDDQVQHAGMDHKWFPDFVRVVEEFEYTQTQKVLVRNLKKVHFDPERVGGDPLFWRERGDESFRAFGTTDFDEQRERFRKAERDQLLEH